mgnify:CR=1 FL=1
MNNPAYKLQPNSDYVLMHKRHLVMMANALDNALVDANSLTFGGRNVHEYRQNVLTDSLRTVKKFDDSQINGNVNSIILRSENFKY